MANVNGPYFGAVGSPITFDATASYDPDSAIVSYEWDLDDNGAIAVDNTTLTIQHVFVGVTVVHEDMLEVFMPWLGLAGLIVLVAGVGLVIGWHMTR